MTRAVRIQTAKPGHYGLADGRWRNLYIVRQDKILAISRDTRSKWFSVSMVVAPRDEAPASWKGHRLGDDDALTLLHQIKGSIANAEKAIETADF